MFDIALTTCKK